MPAVLKWPVPKVPVGSKTKEPNVDENSRPQSVSRQTLKRCGSSLERAPTLANKPRENRAVDRARTPALFASLVRAVAGEGPQRRTMIIDRSQAAPRARRDEKPLGMPVAGLPSSPGGAGETATRSHASHAVNSVDAVPTEAHKPHVERLARCKS